MGALPVPGGVASLARAAGLTTPPHRGHVWLELIRRLHQTPIDGSADPGAGARAAVSRHFVEAGASAAPGDADTVPLPFGIDAWTGEVLGGRVPPGELAREILLDRRAAFVYHGAAALDAGTRRWMVSSPGRLARLASAHAGAFAVFGRSFRVDRGRVAVPGGVEAERVWTALVGAPADDPEAFLHALFRARDGRLAWLYDVTMHLPAGTRRHVVGADLEEPEARVERLRRLADVFAAVGPGWRVADQPFWRPLVDPALFLLELRVQPDGALAPPVSDAFWRPVLGGRGRVDAGRLAARIFLEDPARQRERFELALFAQRVLGASADEDPAGAAAVARGFAKHRVLALSLERMAIRSPEVYARLIGTATRALDAAPAALPLLQGAMALVERARLVRVIDGEAAERVLLALADLDVRAPAGLHDAFGTWLARTFLPAAAARALPDADAALLLALSGERAGSPSSPARAVEWEGHSYVVDLAGAARARMETVRRTQEAPRLAEVLALSDAIRDLPGSPGPAGAAAGRILDDLARRAGDGAWHAGSVPLDQAIVRARRAVSGLARRTAPGRARRVARQLAPLAGRLLAEAVVAWVYAAHLPGDQTELLAGRVHLRHDFGRRLRRAETRALAPWSLAEPVSGPNVPWHLRGSLVSLDVALGPFVLRRVSDDPPAPTLDAGDRRGFARTAALMSAYDVTDEDRDRLAAAVARGRDRLERLRGRPAEAGDVADLAGLSAWRGQALAWTAEEDPAGLEHALSLSELFWLGEPEGDAVARLDAWGTALVGVTGQLATRLPRARPWEEATGHAGSGFLAARSAELNLRTALWLAERRLPAALAPAVMSAAVLELVDRAAVSQPDDWLALVDYVRTLPPSRFEDYVAALTVDGPLRPAARDRSQP